GDHDVAMHLADLFRGLSYVGAGVRILRKYPELRRYWRAPIVLTFAALAASLSLSIGYHEELLSLLWSAPAPDAEGLIATLLKVLYTAARVLSFVLSFAALSLLTIVLSMWIAAP